jgi:hypothetical protein
VKQTFIIGGMTSCIFSCKLTTKSSIGSKKGKHLDMDATVLCFGKGMLFTQCAMQIKATGTAKLFMESCSSISFPRKMLLCVGN